MTFVKDNKMWLIKDVSVILKSKGEFFWKGFIIGIGVTIIIPSKLFSKENRILVFMRLNRGKQMI